MVLNSGVAVRVAETSAACCQRVACIPTSERVSRAELLDLVCCFPLQQLGRLALCIWSFLCLPPPPDHSSYYYYVDSDDDDDSQDDDDFVSLHYADDAYYYNYQSNSD